jgi:hypothetical protein
MTWKKLEEELPKIGSSIILLSIDEDRVFVLFGVVREFGEEKELFLDSLAYGLFNLEEPISPYTRWKDLNISVVEIDKEKEKLLTEVLNSI